LKIRELPLGRHHLRTVVDEEITLECIVEVYPHIRMFSVLETKIIQGDWEDTQPEVDILHSTLDDETDYELVKEG